MNTKLATTGWRRWSTWYHKKFRFYHTTKKYMHKQESVLEIETQNSLWFWDTNRSLNPGQNITPNQDKQKKRTCWIVEFTILVDHGVKIRKNKKRDKYLDLAREQKKLWNMKVAVIPIVIHALGMVFKGLLRRLEELATGGCGKTIQTTVLLRSTRILRRGLETWRNLLSFRLQWKTIS